ncbi:MAG: GerAB/ArcD/ProY family transporter [Candidatus Coproplasma sp.]
MKERISVRQICFILIAYNAVLKLIIYPSAMASSSGNDIIFPALVDLAVQTVVIWSVAYMSSRTNKSFFELLAVTFNKTVARVVYALFALYFILAAIVPMVEQQLLIHSAFYDTVPSLYVFLPFFIFSIYAGAKSFTNAGRCADICLPIFIIAIVAILIMSAGEGEYSNLLPVFSHSVQNLAGCALSSVFKFADSAFLLIFLGSFNYKKGDAAKITLSYAFGGLIVIALLAVFYAVYGAMAPSRTFLLNEISVFFPAISYVGRIDLVLLYALDIVILFAVILHIQASVHCLCYAFSWDKRSALSLAVNAVLIIITFVVNNKFSPLYQAASRWFWIPAVIFTYIVPLSAWALKRRDNE